jgi:hypothetical protein
VCTMSGSCAALFPRDMVQYLLLQSRNASSG